MCSSEDAIQRAVFEHLALRGAAGVFAFHPANGGYRRPVEAARPKGLGVRPGVPPTVPRRKDKRPCPPTNAACP
jgi:hypothetical protein